MQQRALNPHSLSVMTNGGASDTAIRNYLNGKPPAPARLLAIARVLGSADGPLLLRAYGLLEMADKLEEDLTGPGRQTVSHKGEPLTSEEEDRAIKTIRELLEEISRRVEDLERRRHS